MAFILFHSLFYLPGILPFLFRRFRPIQPCDLLGNYFAAKVTDSPSLCQCRQAAAGVSRENLPLRCRAYFPVQSWPVFLPTFRCKKQLKIPKEEIVKVCRQYMITLLQITRECFQKFGYIIDPVLHFDYIIASKKKTLEDIEYELGFPRGWTKIEGISEEQRRQMLRHEFEKDIFLIDYIFNKYLGTDRLGY